MSSSLSLSRSASSSTFALDPKSSPSHIRLTPAMASSALLRHRPVSSMRFSFATTRITGSSITGLATTFGQQRHFLARATTPIVRPSLGLQILLPRYSLTTYRSFNSRTGNGAPTNDAKPCAVANRLGGHATCGRPAPPFQLATGAATAPPVAELGSLADSERLP